MTTHHPKVLALILAGGKGSRLEVLSQVRAKPAAPFGGTYRLIDFALSNCVHSRVGDVWVLEQYQLHSLNDHLSSGRPWDLDRTYGGLRTLPPYQSPEEGEGGFAKGNADALWRHRHALEAFAPDVLLVLSADHLYRMDYRDLVDAHLAAMASGAAVTCVVTEVGRERASRYGVVEADGEGRITRFDYKPESPRGGTVTTEVFAYTPRALLDALQALGEEGEKGGESIGDFGHKLLPRLVGEGRARVHRFEGYWRDVGTLDSYWQAHMDLLGERPALELYQPQAPLLSHSLPRPPARVLPGGELADALLSPGSVVAGRVERSVVGPGVRVEAGAVVRDSVLMEDVVVEAGARVEMALVDEAARVGRGAHVGAARAGEGRPAPEALAVVGQQVQVPPGGRVAPGERLAPDARADWRSHAPPRAG
jgi:glucose-1-phosphate adenylyltransferase